MRRRSNTQGLILHSPDERRHPNASAKSSSTRWRYSSGRGAPPAGEPHEQQPDPPDPAGRPPRDGDRHERRHRDHAERQQPRADRGRSLEQQDEGGQRVDSDRHQAGHGQTAHDPPAPSPTVRVPHALTLSHVTGASALRFTPNIVERTGSLASHVASTAESTNDTTPMTLHSATTGASHPTTTYATAMTTG